MEEGASGNGIAVVGLVAVELVQMKSKHLIFHIIIAHLFHAHLIWPSVKTLCLTQYSQDTFILQTCYSHVLELTDPWHLRSKFNLITVGDSFVFCQVGVRLS